MTPTELMFADLRRFGIAPTWSNAIRSLVSNNRSFKYTFWLRMSRHKSSLIRNFARLMHYHYSNKFQIQIPREAQIGPGLYLGHATTIVVSPTVTIGKNCNLSHFVNIGSNHGKAATIGDNVYVGPSVCIVENVKIGSYSTIGAGSIVIKDIPDRSTAVGNPARVVNENGGKYITNPV